MNGALIIMGYIYNPSGFDWMNFKLTDKNPYTFHHIVEKRNGGDKSIENGAILTNYAHQLLNVFDYFCPEAYNDLQNVFTRINTSGEPPTNDIVKEVDQILYKALMTDEYKYKKEISLSKYRDMYLEGRKELKKCLE